MSQEFKLNLRSLGGGLAAKVEPTPPPAAPVGEPNIGLYSQPSNGRTLGVVWKDGRQYFLNYAYLLCGELKSDSEGDRIELTFTSLSVTLKGKRLKELYPKVLTQEIAIVHVQDARYLATSDTNTPYVTEVVISL